jgi:hypothetical protein
MSRIEACQQQDVVKLFRISSLTMNWEVLCVIALSLLNALFFVLPREYSFSSLLLQWANPSIYFRTNQWPGCSPPFRGVYSLRGALIYLRGFVRLLRD